MKHSYYHCLAVICLSGIFFNSHALPQSGELPGQQNMHKPFSSLDSRRPHSKELNLEVRKMLPPDFDALPPSEKQRFLRNLPPHFREGAERALYKEGHPERGVARIDASGRLSILPGGKNSSRNLPGKYSSPGTATNGVSQVWASRYAGPGVSCDLLTDMAMDRSGNLYGIGYTDTYGTYGGDSLNYFLVKYAMNEARVWMHPLDAGFSSFVAVDSAGMVVTAGFSGLQKMSPDGTLIWDNSSHYYSWGSTVRGMAIDRTGNIYAAYDTTTTLNGPGDLLIKKFNSAGNFIWAQQYGSSGDESIWKMTLDADGAIYVTGTYNGESGSFTAKYDPSGTRMWVKILNVASPFGGFDIAVDKDKDVYVSGYSGLIKYNSTGDTVWTVSHPYDAIVADDSENVYAGGWGGIDKYDMFGNLVWTSSILNVFDIGRDANKDIIATGYYYPGLYYICATAKLRPDGDSVWLMSYAAPPMPYSYGRYLAIDAGGNVYVGCQTPDNHEEDNVVVIQYSGNGAQLWVNTYDGPRGYTDDLAFAVAVDASGHCYATGRSYVGEGRNAFTVKYASDGRSLWETRAEGGGGGADVLTDDSQNVYLIESGKLVKYDSMGTLLWQGTNGGYDAKAARAADGNILVLGKVRNDNYDIVLAKYTPEGDTLWTARYNGPDNDLDIAHDLARDSSGNIYVTGQSDNSDGTSEIVTIKYNTTGAQQWVQRYNDGLGDPPNSSAHGSALAIGKRGHVYTVGCSNRGWVVIKYDSSGSILWSKDGRERSTYNASIVVDQHENIYVGVSGYPLMKIDSSGTQHVSSYSGQCNGWNLLIDPSGSLYTTCNIYKIVKYDQNLDTLWTTSFAQDYPRDMALDSNGNVYVTGWSWSDSTSYDYLTIRYQQQSAINGIIYNDVVRNGRKDIGEPGLEGWTVQLSGSASASTTTDSRGRFRFKNLAPGTYIVQEVPPFSWLPTAPSSLSGYTVTIDANGTEINGRDFGNIHGSTINGIVFHDRNGNRARDPGEQGVAGWKIYLGGGMVDSVITDSVGSFLFVVYPGAYTLREEARTGWIQRSPSPSGEYALTVGSGVDTTGVNFGNFSLGNIGGTVFNDRNGNGRFDPAEPGIAGWKVFLTGLQNDSLFTDANGRFEFLGVPAGSYHVNLRTHPGWIQTLPDSPYTHAVTMIAMGNFPNNDFGNMQLSAIRGIVFADSNSNGLRDSAEHGMSQVNIRVTGADTTTTMTDSAGSYCFSGLSPGTYMITEVTSDRCTQTSPPTPGTYTVQISGDTIVEGRDFGSFGNCSEVVIVRAYARGWNMLSLPVIPTECRKSLLYPNSISQAFSYQGTYVPKDTLSHGPGFWLKFPAPDTVTLCGNPLHSEPIEVTLGWNMIGTISTPIPTTTVGSVPPGIETSPFFGFAGSYIISDTLIPGNAYWIKVSQSGYLMLSSIEGTNPTAHIRISPVNERPPDPPQLETTQGALPRDYALEEAYPNPFNPSTVIRYQLPAHSAVSLRVFDILGREVAVLVDEAKPPGMYEAQLLAGNLASGVYFYRLQAGSYSAIRKMLLMK